MRRRSLFALVPLVSLVLTTSSLRPPGASGAPQRPRIARVAASARDLASTPRSLRLDVPDHVPGELLVRFGGSTDRARRDRAVAAVSGVTGRRVVASLDVRLVRIAGSADVLAAARRLGRQPGVLSAEPNWVRHTMQTIPDDPLFEQLWGFNNTGQPHAIADPPPDAAAGLADADADVPEAWDAQTGSSDVVIAIADTGMDMDHPDLASNLWVNPDETPEDGTDDDGNGLADDVNGWDFRNDDAVPADRNGHGTHVAGTAAAIFGNATGVAGVCPGCRLMILQVGGANGIISSAALLEAVEYAAGEGADILNLSISGPQWSKIERTTLARSGMLVVVAAGNDASDNDMLDWNAVAPDIPPPSYPASYDLPNLIAVAASDDTDEYGSFTNWGRTSVDLAAPGVDITSTWTFGGYQVLNGTSMASPFVAGVAGLVLSENPTYDPVDLKNAILNAVERPANLPGAFTVTKGRVNALAALTAPTTNATLSTDGTMRGAASIRSRASGSLSQPGDVNDIYRKRLRRGHRYEIRLTVPTGRDFDLYIWKPGSTDTWPVDLGCGFSCRLAAASQRGTGQDEAGVFQAGKTGTYYFHVTTFAGNGTYTLTIEAI